MALHQIIIKKDDVGSDFAEHNGCIDVALYYNNNSPGSKKYSIVIIKNEILHLNDVLSFTIKDKEF